MLGKQVPQPSSEEQLLSRSALANRLQRSAAWVDAQVRDGMPCEQPGGGHTHRRFRLSEVKAWLEQRGSAQLTHEGKVAAVVDMQQLANALTEAAGAAQDEDESKLADALRAVSKAAERLADALERAPGSVPSSAGPRRPTRASSHREHAGPRPLGTGRANRAPRSRQPVTVGRAPGGKPC